MFNIGSGEIALIAVVALLVLGPSRLPELARGIGKFMREFRKQTDEVRGVVEREFYKMDTELALKEPTPLTISAAPDAVAMNDEHVPSQLTAGMPEEEVSSAPSVEPQAIPPPDPPTKS